MNTKTFLHSLVGLVTLLALVLSQPAAAQGGSSRLVQPPAPHTPLVAGDEFWGSFPVGTDQAIYTVAITGSDVYVGGDFTQAGNIPANHVARWSNATHQWYALGAGVNSRVESIAIYGTYVYVGGYFNQAGGQAIDNVARWDSASQTWSAPGSGDLTHSIYSPDVSVVAVDASGNLFIGGQFETVGGVSARNIARWNGSIWSALGSGLGSTNETVNAIDISGSDLYAGGDFTTPSTGIAHWNGSAWSGLGSGTAASFYKEVSAVAISGSNVYIGGSFDKVSDSGGPHDVKHIAMWSGSAWSALGTAPNDGVNAGVYTLANDAAGNIYVGGQFTSAGSGTTTSHIARWNGSAWSSLASSLFVEGADSNVYSVLVDGSSIYAGGNETYAGGVSVGHIGRYDTSAGAWYGLGSSVDSTVNALALKGSQVYLGGTFNSVNGMALSAIGQWSSAANTWPAMGSALSGCSGMFCSGPSVKAVLAAGSDIFVTGNFTAAGGIPANGIARWNTVDQQWHAMGSGLDCSGFLCIFSGLALAYDPAASRLYVGGSFSSAGGVSGANLAMWSLAGGWSNVTWQDAGTHAINPNGPVYALSWNGTYLYAGGNFATPFSYLFSTDFHGVYSQGASPLNGTVYALAADASNLYAGGAFTNANGSATTSYLARLTSPAGSWLAVGTGLNDVVYALALRSSRLAAGGAFTSSGALGLAHIGLWNGSAWANLGSGTDGVVNGVALDGDFIYAGGAFTHAGGKAAVGFSRWGQYHVYLPQARK